MDRFHGQQFWRSSGRGGHPPPLAARYTSDMPLFDAYGQPIVPGPDARAATPLARLFQLLRSVLRAPVWFRRLNPIVRVAIAIGSAVSTIATLFWCVQQFRQELLVDPYVSYDSKEAFQQQFTITNNGPFAIYDVHYSCAV